MSVPGVRTVAKAATERITGLGPGPIRAFAAAALTGTATAVLTYRVLRSQPDSSNDS